MGVLNFTPDSFSDGGKFFSKESALDHVAQMIEEGADIVDVGGESSRPGAEPVSEIEELKRVVPIIEEIASRFSVPISIDTYKASVAKTCIEMGASIINDISAMRFDPKMIKVAKDSNAFLILMHMKGNPKNMQDLPDYNDVISDILSFFKERIHEIKNGKIDINKIIIDPGIGFGKSIMHNYTIIRDLKKLDVFDVPIIIGTSRKSFLGKTLNLPEMERLEGTAASITAAVLNGARIVRVHDVKEMKRVVKVTDSIKNIGLMS
ncbi:MAG: dihydropteroate synthase [Candidatus Marinimicrobia bacterium]|nr:dihydropteroate synthase [Candidatus Neomarinimicrobiota bacterium]